jgi:phosphoribosylglycinamide formyltransferase 2
MGIAKRIGTPLSPSATKVMLLGCGELGKEVIIALQRLGCEVIGVDRYPDAPGMQVAHRSHVVTMTDGNALRELIAKEKPALVVPEIEAIATAALVEMERDGVAGHFPEFIPTARAAHLTMNREGIRRLAAEELGLATSPYKFADTLAELQAAIDGSDKPGIGYPCVIKPVMSSSGKGQSLVKSAAEVQQAWDYSQAAGRVGAGRIIVEGFIDFDYEITQLTVRAVGVLRRGGNLLLRTHRPCAGEWRLRRELAADGDDAGRAAKVARHRPGRDHQPGRPRHFRRRTVRQGRPGLVLRGQPAPA